MIVQDKKFTADGQIDYQLDVMTAAVGWFGDTLLTNGAIYTAARRAERLAAFTSAQRV